MSREVFVGKKRMVKRQPMILVVMEQWSQAACANCEIFFRNAVVKSENQRKAQSPCRTPEYMVQSIPVQGCPSTHWKARAHASAPRRATAGATKPTQSPCPGQGLRHPSPAQEGKETVFIRAVTISRQTAFLHLSRQAKQPARPMRQIFCSWTYSSFLHKRDIKKLQIVMYFFFPMGHARKTTPVQSSSSSHLATGAQIFVMTGKKKILN